MLTKYPNKLSRLGASTFSLISTLAALAFLHPELSGAITRVDQSYNLNDKCAYSYLFNRYFGDWNSVTSTCTLTEDVTDTLVVGPSVGYGMIAITLDCGGKNVSAETGRSSAISVTGSHGFPYKIKNCNIHGAQFGMISEDSGTLYIENNTISGSTDIGINTTWHHTPLFITGNVIENNYKGAFFPSTLDVIADPTTDTGYRAVRGLTVTDNTFRSNVYGLTFTDLNLALIYNNVFLDNSLYDIFQFEMNASSNQWNIGPTTPGPNALGGPMKGGNAYLKSDGTGFSQTCTDRHHDGFCDSPYFIPRDWVIGGLDYGNVDNYPLAGTLITPPIGNLPPVANPGGPYSGTAGISVLFNGSLSSDPDGTTLSYSWSFGDGATGVGATPSHSYAQAGSFSVSLTVTDASGASNTASTVAQIQQSPPTQQTPEEIAEQIIADINEAVYTGDITASEAAPIISEFDRFVKLGGFGRGHGGSSGCKLFCNAKVKINFSNLLKKINLKVALKILKGLALLARAAAGDPTAYIELAGMVIGGLGDLGVIPPAIANQLSGYLNTASQALNAANAVSAISNLQSFGNTVSNLSGAGQFPTEIADALSAGALDAITNLAAKGAVLAALEVVKSKITDFISQKVLDAGFGRSLIAKIDEARKLLAQGKDADARHLLEVAVQEARSKVTVQSASLLDQIGTVLDLIEQL